ncbi:MAG: hypothetical protein JO250_09775 [Armatimonadetes bacterium]|nr:hypothetical protein [Armatimonadota bacterium]
MPDTDEPKRLSVPVNPARALRDLSRQQASAPAPPDGEANNTILQTDKQTDKPTNKQDDLQTNQQTDRRAEAERPPRADGRTLRARLDTADRTMVTSLRLAVSTVERLDEYCWRRRRRKQDVVQAALDLYFAAADAEEP